MMNSVAFRVLFLVFLPREQKHIILLLGLSKGDRHLRTMGNMDVGGI